MDEPTEIEIKKIDSYFLPLQGYQQLNRIDSIKQTKDSDFWVSNLQAIRRNQHESTMRLPAHSNLVYEPLGLIK